MIAEDECGVVAPGGADHEQIQRFALLIAGLRQPAVMVEVKLHQLFVVDIDVGTEAQNHDQFGPVLGEIVEDGLGKSPELAVRRFKPAKIGLRLRSGNWSYSETTAIEPMPC